MRPESAAAYVRELSADVRAVVVLAADGSLLAGPPALAGPAAALTRSFRAGTLTHAGTRVWVASTSERTIVAIGTGTSPTALDVAAAIGSPNPPEPVENPSPELKTAVQHVIAAT